MQQKIKILRAKPTDAKAIEEVYYKTWLATYPDNKYGVTIDDIKHIYRNRNNTEELMKKQKIMAATRKEFKRFVAKSGDKIVGLCNITVDSDKNQLNAIYILPKYQGKGIGKMFWNKIHKLFNLKNKTIVHVAEYNTNAIEFYKKLGFKVTKKRFENQNSKMKSGAIIPEIEMIILGKRN
jgi:GNAT superfamily N-acetyltransferase